MTLHFWIFQHALWLVHFIFVFLFLAHLLRQRKTPASTLAWFLIVLVAPYAGIPLYLSFGFRKYLTSKPLIFEGHQYHNGTLVDPIQRTLAASGSALPCGNAEIILLDSGEKAFHSIAKMIEQARQSIYIETYIFSSDEVGIELLKLLSKRANEGIDIRILVDAVGAKLPGHPSFRDFKKAGGLVAFFNPVIHMPFRNNSNLRNHRKQILVDGIAGVIGGMNIGNEYMGPSANPKRWVDIAIVIRGAIVSQLQEIFLADWTYAATKTKSPIHRDIATASQNHLAQLVVSGPDITTDPIYEFLLTAIYGARERVWIATPYFVPDDALSKALELASRRGVDVRLLIPKKSNHILADLSRSTYVQQIQESGARIFLFPKMVHAKATLIDESYALVGSANLDGRSLFLNYELGLCLYDAQDILVIKNWFESVFENCPEGFAKLNWLQELGGDLARITSPLV